METLFPNITLVIKETLKVLGTVTTCLIGNEIFAIIIGLIILSIIIGIIFYMISKTKMARYRKIVSKNYIGSENWSNRQVRECARLNNYWK